MQMNESPVQIAAQKYQLLQKIKQELTIYWPIGQGSQGQVVQSIHVPRKVYKLPIIPNNENVQIGEYLQKYGNQILCSCSHIYSEWRILEYLGNNVREEQIREGILQVYDYKEPSFQAEYCDMSFFEIVERLRFWDQSFSRSLIIWIAKSLSTVLRKIHQLNCYHLDVKPLNLLIAVRFSLEPNIYKTDATEKEFYSSLENFLMNLKVQQKEKRNQLRKINKKQIEVFQYCLHTNLTCILRNNIKEINDPFNPSLSKYEFDDPSFIIQELMKKYGTNRNIAFSDVGIKFEVKLKLVDFGLSLTYDQIERDPSQLKRGTIGYSKTLEQGFDLGQYNISNELCEQIDWYAYGRLIQYLHEYFGNSNHHEDDVIRRIFTSALEGDVQQLMRNIAEIQITEEKLKLKILTLYLTKGSATLQQ